MSGKKSDDGVSEIIAFMLIFALIVTFFAVWALFYVPSEGTTAEVQHDEDVLRQFSDIKTGIDLLWTTDNYKTIQRLVSLAPTKATDFATMLFLSPSIGSGMMKVETGTRFQFNDTLYSSLTGEQIPGDSYKVTTLRLTYTSYNQYTGDFAIVYDGGAVFYGEVGGKMALLESPVMSNLDGNGNILYIMAVDDNYLNDDGELKSEKIIVGNNPIPVSITYVRKNDPEFIEVYHSQFNNIESDYSDYWSNYVLNNDISQVAILNFKIDLGSE